MIMVDNVLTKKSDIINFWSCFLHWRKKVSSTSLFSV